MNSHFSNRSKNRGYNPELYADYQKLGKSKFEIDTLHEVKEDDRGYEVLLERLDYLESHEVLENRALHPDGYNLMMPVLGKRRRKKVTQVTRVRQSNAHKQRHGSAQKKEQILELLEQNPKINNSELAKAVGTCRQTISSWTSQQNTENHMRQYDPEFAIKFHELRHKPKWHVKKTPPLTDGLKRALTIKRADPTLTLHGLAITMNLHTNTTTHWYKNHPDFRQSWIDIETSS